MNTKRIEARAHLDYSVVINNIITNKTMSDKRLIIYLCKQIIVLQKYIFQLLLDRVEKKGKILELINE